MRPYPVQSFANNRELFHKFIVPFVGKFHLDYGCGNGLSTFVLALRSPLSTIVGYDPNPKTLAKAEERLAGTNRFNLIFRNDLREFDYSFGNFDHGGVFDSATANFVFHENPGVISEIYPWLTKTGRICIFDYNLKGVSREEFRKNFDLDNELRVIQGEGFETSYLKHTQFGIEDCVSRGEQAGFITTDTEVFDKHFIWFGEKKGH
jgi:SAM-dependent methyltransferase